ncbi:MAG: CRTAC1 family protein [Myxococcota bacterium]
MRRVIAMVSGLAGCTDRNPTPADSGSDGLATVEARLDAPGEVTCADPSAREVQKMAFGELRAEAEKKRWFWGVGVVVADFDLDGNDDLVLPGLWETVFYEGLGGGQFVEIPWSNVADSPATGGSGGTAADYDGDGDFDLLITKYLGRNALYRNDGGRLVDVSVAAGLGQDFRRSMASSWGDLDHDGDLDLYIGCYQYIDESMDDSDHAQFVPGEPDWLYLNDGDGTFTDVSDRLPQNFHDGYTLGGGFVDLDSDGWLDLYGVSDFGEVYPSRLLWNREGVLVADENAHGLDLAMTGMGLAVGDVNGDAIPDLMVPAWNGNHALLSGAGGRGWFESVQLIGPINDLSRAQRIAWGGDLVDMDNDGDLDLPLSYGFLDAAYASSQTQPDALYLQGEDGVFVDAGAAWGMNHPGANRGFASVDLNRDGYVDVVRRDTGGPPLVYLSSCGEASWLEVDLQMPGQNRYAIGARVVVEAEGERQLGWIRAGGTNFGTGTPPVAHFGLGAVSRVDSVEVYWPDGEVSVTRDVDVRQRVTLARD